MSKNRGGVLLFIIIVLLAVVVFFYLRRNGGLPLFSSGSTSTTVPVDLQSLVPPGWQVEAEPQLQCDFDGDGRREWLIFYRYNSTTLPVPLAKQGTTVTFSPLGGVIYDAQPDTLQPQPDNPGPYRASNLVPYKLLPDYYPGKGQGYLGESSITVNYWPAVKEGEDCKTTEVNVYGYSGGSFPTRVSVFHWEGTNAGYQVAHFVGDARVESTTTADGQVNQATTYNRLQNHRSVLCDVQANLRPDPGVLTFIPDAAVQTIDFCFGPPNDPVYPEGVVVAVLRGAPAPTTPQLPSYFLDNAVVPQELQFLKDPRHEAVNIVALGNPSTVTPVAVRGAPCTTAEVAAAARAGVLVRP